MADKYLLCAALLVAAADTATGELCGYWLMNINQNGFHHILIQTRLEFFIIGFCSTGYELISYLRRRLMPRDSQALISNVL